MLKYIHAEGIDLDIDNFLATNNEVFIKEEKSYSLNSKYRLLSLLSVAFIQLGIIEI